MQLHTLLPKLWNRVTRYERAFAPHCTASCSVICLLRVLSQQSNLLQGYALLTQLSEHCAAVSLLGAPMLPTPITPIVPCSKSDEQLVAFQTVQELHCLHYMLPAKPPLAPAAAPQQCQLMISSQ